MNDTTTGDTMVSILSELRRLNEEQADLSEALSDRIELDALTIKTRKLAERFNAREARHAQRIAARAGNDA